MSQVRPRRPKRISVTELITPPQLRALTLKHWDDLQEDASDRIWAAVGTLMHTMLEKHGDISDHLSEQFLETEVDGYTVTGVADLYHASGRVTDYKFVSVWTAINGIKTEWEQQLNLYAELFRRSGFEVNKLEIVALFRDWSKSRANDADYPQSQVKVFDVPLWQQYEASEFLDERVRLHKEAEQGSYPDCTSQERWERPTQYAIMKEGRKSAVRLFDDREMAEAALSMLPKNHSLVKRTGQSIRCESYCAAAPFCRQRAAMFAQDHVETEAA